jgi:methylenetetrahydrofolate dehydrogenase (NADP+)/methenyltetrahydrofolate cyclohydrolase
MAGPARDIDGRAVAAALRAGLATRVAALEFQPGLAVILVGQNPASAVYVRNKDRAATACGLSVRTITLPEHTGQAELMAVIADLNADPAVDGILLQLPLPPGLQADVALSAIDPAKDVDGLHPCNAGLIAAGRPGLTPCTPLGVMKLLASAGVAVSGARALVLGRSVLVGRPMAALLTSADATVTLAHSRTQGLESECRRADILVAAIGRPQFVRGDWIKPGAVVIDVGINRTADGRLVGDTDYAGCRERASAITPVPGGVGPMTIACLLENTVSAALAIRGLPARLG